MKIFGIFRDSVSRIAIFTYRLLLRVCVSVYGATGILYGNNRYVVNKKSPRNLLRGFKGFYFYCSVCILILFGISKEYTTFVIQYFKVVFNCTLLIYPNLFIIVWIVRIIFRVYIIIASYSFAKAKGYTVS